MNLSELKSKVLEQLSEDPTDPQFWTLAEIVANINDGYREVLRRTGLGAIMLPLLQAETGAFYFPSDIMKLHQVYYQGRKIGHKGVEFLEAKYSGTDHDDGLRGAGTTFGGNFRDITGTPGCWYLEDGKIKLFPKPATAAVTSTAIREVTYATLAAGSLTLTLTDDIPTDARRVDVWLDGIYQFLNQWSIINANRIDFVGPDLGIATQALVRFIPDDVTTDVLSSTKKFLVYLSAGATKIPVPGGYVQGVGALTISIDGIDQAPTEWTEPSPTYANLTTAVPIDSVVQVSVTHPDPNGVPAARYTARPQNLVDDADQPANLPDDFQEGIWQWACHRCLSKDGRGADPAKALVMLGLFEKTLSDTESIWRPEVTFDPAVMLPFQM